MRSLVFDSTFDTYRGVVTYVRVVDGSVKAGDSVKMMATNGSYEVKEVGLFKPQQPKFFAQPVLNAGDVGYVIANIKTTSEVKVGDTLTNGRTPAEHPLPGFQVVQPMVFSGIYPINTADFEHLKAAMGKLQLNDASFVFQAESSVALGFGFRCGFLGLLHMEIIQERLRREYDMDIIATYPSVIYEVEKTNGEVLHVDNPEFLPDASVIKEIREPIVKCFIMVPNEYISPLMQLIMDKRGMLDHTETLDARRVMLTTILPLNEILVDFNDKIKSITRGYGSMDYEHAGYRADKLVKLDILVNSEPVDAFSSIVHRDKAESRGRVLAAKLKEVIPTQLYQVAIQAAIGGKVVARENVSAMRKNVTAKCYGGDISRKRKLLEKQKEGKKRMKAIGRVNIPQEAFIEVLKAN
jgi:GTP-binding protein LepA